MEGHILVPKKTIASILRAWAHKEPDPYGTRAHMGRAYIYGPGSIWAGPMWAHMEIWLKAKVWLWLKPGFGVHDLAGPSWSK